MGSSPKGPTKERPPQRHVPVQYPLLGGLIGFATAMVVCGGLLGNQRGGPDPGAMMCAGFAFAVVGVFVGALFGAGKTGPGAPSRTCPHCAEAIQPAAKVCKHCGRDVEPVAGG